MEREEPASHQHSGRRSAAMRAVRGPTRPGLVRISTRQSALHVAAMDAIRQLFPCCCPPGRSTSIRLKEVFDGAAEPSRGMPDLDGPGERKHTVHTRRRAAVTSERSELLANVRWRSAFEAVRRSEVKSPERTAEIVGVLRKHSLFAEWDEAVLEQISHAMREQMVREGDAVVTQGEPGDSFYIVRHGVASCTQQDGDGKVQEVARLEEGSYFGEIALLTQKPRQATVVALHDE